MNGSIASSSGVTVNAGATLGGTGTVPSTTISGGTPSPGNSVGTISISGNLTFVGAGNYLVEVAPGAADRSDCQRNRRARRHDQARRAAEPPSGDLHADIRGRRLERNVPDRRHHRQLRAGRAQCASRLRREQSFPPRSTRMRFRRSCPPARRQTSAPLRLQSMPASRRATRRPHSSACSVCRVRHLATAIDAASGEARPGHSDRELQVDGPVPRTDARSVSRDAIGRRREHGPRVGARTGSPPCRRRSRKRCSALARW